MNLFTFQFYGIYLVREATFDSALYFYNTDDKFIDITDMPYVLTMDIFHFQLNKPLILYLIFSITNKKIASFVLLTYYYQISIILASEN